MSSADYHTRILSSLSELSAAVWDALVDANHAPPFMRHAFLDALHECGCATPRSGWTPQFITLWSASSAEHKLVSACIMYAKKHSQGEYVFDYAWANAHEQHGVRYYPKLLSAVPFTPVPACKLLAHDERARAALLDAVLTHAKDSGLSSLHMLYLTAPEVALAQSRGMMLRHGVQFHWSNREPQPYADFEDFLSSFNAEKRKKTKQEERYVQEQGMSFELLHASDITADDWTFFYSCYSRTYYEHGNPPYLSEAFFQSVGAAMPACWLMIIASRDVNGKTERIAASLIALDPVHKVAYGRYWGMALRIDKEGVGTGPAHVPHLHFNACYYQPLRWCIAHGYTRFEGGAQGEHKMARGLMPVQTTSAHWLKHPQFSDAIARYLEREGEGISQYMSELELRSPLRKV
jgi:uncharacterized protein